MTVGPFIFRMPVRIVAGDLYAMNELQCNLLGHKRIMYIQAN